MAGKGDTPRKVDGKKFRENYDRIWRRTCPDQMSDWTDLQIEPDMDLVKDAAAHQLSEDIKDLREMLQSAQKENEEQARLLAMSTDREEKLRGQLQDAEIRALYEQRLKNTYKKLLKQ